MSPGRAGSDRLCGGSWKTAPLRKNPSRVISHLRLSTIALVSLVAVFMVTALPAATGDNIADAVLGQIDFSHNGINNTRAASLDSPSQMAVDLSSSPEHLYVVDGSNNRMLGWNDATSFVNGQNADLEIGQPDFRTTQCNSGIAIADVAGLGADSLCLPGGVAVDSSGNLYVADTEQQSRARIQSAVRAGDQRRLFGECRIRTRRQLHPDRLRADGGRPVFSARRRLRFEQQSLRRRLGQSSRARIQSAAGRVQSGHRGRRHRRRPRLWTRRERHRFHWRLLRHQQRQRVERRDVQSAVSRGRRLGQFVRRRRRRSSRARIQSAAGGARCRRPAPAT